MLTGVEGDVVGSSGHDHHASGPLKVVLEGNVVTVMELPFKLKTSPQVCS